MDEQIPNKELTLDMIPGAGDDQLIILAHTFNPYHYWGSYDRSVDVAYEATDKLRTGKVEDITLTELRTLLFMYARSLRHIFVWQDVEFEKLIVEALREKIASDVIK